MRILRSKLYYKNYTSYLKSISYFILNIIFEAHIILSVYFKFKKNNILFIPQ